MNRKEFGRLVAALRKENMDEHLQCWTQERLAQEANLPVALIGNIERGTKTNIYPDTLVKLANALHLTTGERKAFFAEASGVDIQHTLRPSTETPMILQEMLSILGNSFVPTVLMDSYCDIVAMNHSFFIMYAFKPEDLTPQENNPTQYNIMRLIFGPDFEFQQKRIMGWDRWAYTTLMLFREMCLKHRAEPHMIDIISSLNKYPKFRQVWVFATHGQELEVKDQFTDNTLVSFNHPEFGWIKSITSSITSQTSFGELNLYSLQPIDEHTFNTFNKIVEKQGRKTIAILPNWPDKPTLKKRESS